MSKALISSISLGFWLVTSCSLYNTSRIDSAVDHYALKWDAVLYDTVSISPYDSIKRYSKCIELINITDNVFVDELWIDYYGCISDEIGKYHIMKTFTADGKKYMENWHYDNGALVYIVYFVLIKDDGKTVSYGRIGKRKFE